MLTPTGIITSVRVNELIPRECFCMLYAQWVNLFGTRVALCLLPATIKMLQGGRNVAKTAKYANSL
jgi:hypothetical protein